MTPPERAHLLPFLSALKKNLAFSPFEMTIEYRLNEKRGEEKQREEISAYREQGTGNKGSWSVRAIRFDVLQKFYERGKVRDGKRLRDSRVRVNA